MGKYKTCEEVRQAIRNAPSYKKLLRVCKSSKKSTRPLGEDRWFFSCARMEAMPEDMLTAHASVMDRKSSRAKTLARLADAVFAETGLPRRPKGKFRGEDGLDWKALGIERKNVPAPADWDGETY